MGLERLAAKQHPREIAINNILGRANQMITLRRVNQMTYRNNCIKTARIMLLVTSFALFFVGVRMAWSSPGAEEKRTLSLASYQWTQPGIMDWFHAVSEAFMKEYPEIEVVPEVVPGTEYWDKMIVQVRAGSTADLMQVDGIAHQLLAAGFLEPLDPWIEEETDILERFHPLLNILKRDGHLYALIYSMSNWNILFYSKELIEKAGRALPETIEEFFQSAVELTDGAVYGYDMSTQQNPDDQLVIALSQIDYLFGGAWAKNGMPTINSPENIQGVTFYKKLVDAGVSPMGMDTAQRRQMFREGKIAMHMDGPWFIRQVLQDSAWVENLGALAPPTAVGEEDKVYMAQFSAFAMPKAAKNKEDARKFLEFQSRHPWQVKMLELTLQSPGEAGVTSDKVLNEYPWMETSWQIDKYATQLRYPAGLEEFYPAFRRILATYVAQILLQDKPVEAALEQAQEEFEALVAK